MAAERQICSSTLIFHIVSKTVPMLLPLVGWLAGKLAGWQTNCEWILKFILWAKNAQISHIKFYNFGCNMTNTGH